MNTYLEITKNLKLKEALIFFGQGVNTLIIKKNKKVLGVFTFGDFIKHITKKHNLEENINKNINKNFIYVREGYTFSDIEKIFNQNHFLFDLVVLNKNNEFKEVLNRKKFVNQYKYFNGLDVVIMAGGKGIRLRPFTNYFPKALYVKNDEVLLKKILDKFYENGFRKSILCLKYKSELIKAYLKNYEKRFKFTFSTEKKPLGTAGGLSLIKNKVSKNFFLTNCDLLIDFDYTSAMEFHKKNKCDMTILTAYKNFKIPYGSIEADSKGNLKSIIEKPNRQYLLNTGFYILNKKILKYIKNNVYLDMDQFIKVLKKKKKVIKILPIPESSWDDFVEKYN